MIIKDNMMNNEIRKLAENAGFVFWSKEEDETMPIDWSSNYDEEFEIFANSIIQKCIDICNEGTLTQTTSAGAAQRIQQYFSV